jgi:hypothetical protein
MAFEKRSKFKNSFPRCYEIFLRLSFGHGNFSKLSPELS